LRLSLVSKLYAMFHRKFNEHFTRQETRDFEHDARVLIAPADSCLLAYTIRGGEMLSVKNRRYTLAGFLKDAHLAREYEGGMLLIFRLRVCDCHRFCFIDDGAVVCRKRIRGFLDSVNSAATGKFALSSNCRELSVLSTAHFGDIVFAEIGAMLVGRVVRTHSAKTFSRGEEKGYFEFGGSSIVLLLKKDTVKIDGDILAFSANGIETRVRMGERIGEKLV